MNRPFSRRQAMGLVAGASPAYVWLVGLLRHANAFAGSGAPLEAPWKPRWLDPKEARTLEAAVDAIIPATDTPGARAALAHHFIDALMSEAEGDLRDPFRAGLKALMAKGPLLPALTALAAQCDAHTVSVHIERQLDAQYCALPVLDLTGIEPAQQQLLNFFVALKSLTTMGYFTSKLFEAHLFHADYAGCAHGEGAHR